MTSFDFRVFPRRPFARLSEQEILALAISSEEEDARIYATYAERLRVRFPATAMIFDAMAAEEGEHRRRLIEMHEARFGGRIPLIRREHVSGFYSRRPYWLVETLGLERVREEAASMEREASAFYFRAAQRTQDSGIRKLLGDLGEAESEHIEAIRRVAKDALPDDVRTTENAQAHRDFVLTYVQPGLAGLMDGSVSTLAPIFAAAFATGQTWQTFLVGLAASIGAGISMGFTEAASDDGQISGRGSPLKRGLVCGAMTACGGLGHALPYLIPHFWIATVTAFIVVFFELWAIAWVQKKYMEVPFWRAALQIVVGGSLVLAVGILIGSA